MFRSLLGMVLVAIVMVGCGKTEQQKTQDKVDDGNHKIARMSEINQTVHDNYHVTLVSTSASSYEIDTANDRAIARLRNSEIENLKPLVVEFRSLANDVLAILDSSSNVTYKGSRSDITRARSAAEHVQVALDSAGQLGGVQPATDEAM